MFEFGDLRAVTELVREQPERVDQALWIALHLPQTPEAEDWLFYMTDKLRDVPCGPTSAAEVLLWLREGIPALEARLAAHQGETPHLVEPHHVRDWACGLAWLLARGAGALEWCPSGYDSVNWISISHRDAMGQERWVGIGLQREHEIRLFDGRSDHDNSEADDEDVEPHMIRLVDGMWCCYRRCRVEGGAFWPGIPDALKRRAGVSDDALRVLETSWVYIEHKRRQGRDPGGIWALASDEGERDG